MIAFFLESLWLVWLIVSLCCLLIELTSGDLYLLCFAFGAIASLVLALCGAPFWLQVLVWAIASVLCIIFVRPSLVKRLHANKERLSNADAMIGQKGRVTTAIPADGFGYVKIAGDEWRSVSANKTDIPAGTTVTVVSRDSTILTVVEK